jgi:peptidoglycan LD-endopeptidase LytH
MQKSTTLLLVLAITQALSACAPGERLAGRPPAPQPRAASPHDLFAATLARTDPAAARAWEDASRRALRAGLSIAPSFRERVRFGADAHHAVAYRFSLREGQALRIRYERMDGGGPLFADVFHVLGGELFRPAAAAARGARELRFAAVVGGEYVLRLQPAAGDGGLYDILVEGEAGLFFPVAGAGLHAIGSIFGDSRDGGLRRHEGVDIFAPHGTPVLAAAAGRVTEARHTPVGGNVVWVEDAAGVRYYYAHLTEYHVAPGAWVAAGDHIGTVGNTGNARSVAPHLHFGVYQPGRVAIDPGPLLAGMTELADVAAVAVDADVIGRWVRVAAPGVPLRRSPAQAAAVITELDEATTVFVLSAVADWKRVVLSDGTSGFVAAQATTETGPAGW